MEQAPHLDELGVLHVLGRGVGGVRRKLHLEGGSRRAEGLQS